MCMKMNRLLVGRNFESGAAVERRKKVLGLADTALRFALA
jgi:hypothetical protein